MSIHAKWFWAMAILLALQIPAIRRGHTFNVFAAGALTAGCWDRGLQWYFERKRRRSCA